MLAPFSGGSVSSFLVWTFRVDLFVLAVGRIMGEDRKGSKPSGNDKFRWNRNLSFRNDLLEFKLDAIFDLFENRGTFKKRPDYTPYAFIGFAMFLHNPKAKINGKWVALKPLSTEGQGLGRAVLADGSLGREPPKPYSLIQPAIPFGVGFRYKLDRQLDIAFEIGWRATFTDYLDDVGGFYYDRQTLIDEKGIKENGLVKSLSYKLLRSSDCKDDDAKWLFFHPDFYNPLCLLIDEFVLCFSFDDNFEDIDKKDCLGMNEMIKQAPINKADSDSKEKIKPFDNATYKQMASKLVEMAKEDYNDGLDAFFDKVHVTAGGKG
ncbi:MAG: hypothetical protein IID44_30610, partial [Planctomycetes bacterium]|nr:hypothetical protein [Planctomycetota bacterium]